MRRLDPVRREKHRLMNDPSIDLFQPFPTTGEDRYPLLFAELARKLDGMERPRVLSYGCASGEEVRSLRRHLPHAEIVGLDPNRLAIGKARQRDGHPLSSYRIADAPDPDETFDAILAMAVFRHGSLEDDAPATCTAIMPFARFAAGVARLDRVLAPGGWLAIWHSHFRFADCAVAAAYEADRFTMADHDPMTLLYGPDDRRIDTISERAVLYRKRQTM